MPGGCHGRRGWSGFVDAVRPFIGYYQYPIGARLSALGRRDAHSPAGRRCFWHRTGPAVLAERLAWRHAGVVFVADDLAGWLIGLLADAGRKKLTSLVLGSEQERALRSAASMTPTMNRRSSGSSRRSESACRSSR